jgi:hypothetical protein
MAVGLTGLIWTVAELLCTLVYAAGGTR